MSVPSVGDLLKGLPHKEEIVDLGEGLAEILVPMELDKPFEPGNQYTISDKHFIPPAQGPNRKDLHLGIARMHLRDACAHLSLAKWHDTKLGRQRDELLKELGTLDAALDEVLRLRAELEKRGQGGA